MEESASLGGCIVVVVLGVVMAGARIARKFVGTGGG